MHNITNQIYVQEVCLLCKKLILKGLLKLASECKFTFSKLLYQKRIHIEMTSTSHILSYLYGRTRSFKDAEATCVEFATEMKKYSRRKDMSNANVL